MNIKSLRLALEQAATRSTPPGRAPASVFETGSTRARQERRQRATRPQVSTTRERRASGIKSFERIAHPTVTTEGRRAPALRFGDPRVQALAGALCTSLLAVTGITNKSLRALMTELLGQPYSMNRSSYDLTRLRRNGLIDRVDGRNLYQLTDDGLAFAIFYTKVHNRVLRPLLATAAPQAPPPLRAALRTIDQHVNARVAHARLPAAAA
jgi:hypothetical protein